MKVSLLARFAVLFVLLGRASYADDASDFFDMDIPAAELPDLAATKPREDPRLAGLPENIRKMLGKLDQFTAVKRAQLDSKISAGRKVAAEILVKNSLKADAAARAQLLEEAKRVESLPPDRPLVEAPSSSPAESARPLRMLLGSWHCPSVGWTATLTPDGKVSFDNGTPTGNWHWVDEKRGTFVWTHTNVIELVQMNPRPSRPQAVLLIKGASQQIEKKADLPNQDSNPRQDNKKSVATEPVTMLAASELVSRRDTDALIHSKEVKVAGWLLQQAPALPAVHTRLLAERAAEWENTRPAPTSTAPTAPALEGPLKGVWKWTGKKLEFAEGGVLLVNKIKAGKWEWGKPGSTAAVVFVIERGDTVAIAWLSQSVDGLMQVRTTKGASDAKRE
jgi:hypothetical protein